MAPPDAGAGSRRWDETRDVHVLKEGQHEVSAKQ